MAGLKSHSNVVQLSQYTQAATAAEKKHAKENKHRRDSLGAQIR